MSTLRERSGRRGLRSRRARRLIAVCAVSTVGYPIGYTFAAMAGVDRLLRPVAALVLCVAAVLAGRVIVRTTTAAAAGAMTAIVASPDAMIGSSSRDDLSRADALVMRGDVRGALALVEERIANSPDDMRARMRAAELYAGAGGDGDVDRAARMLRSVQRASDAPAAVRIHATHRLMDLCDGPLGMPKRVLVELRWLIETFPGTPAARSARETLARLKSG